MTQASDVTPGDAGGVSLDKLAAANARLALLRKKQDAVGRDKAAAVAQLQACVAIGDSIEASLPQQIAGAQHLKVHSLLCVVLFAYHHKIDIFLSLSLSLPP